MPDNIVLVPNKPTELKEMIEELRDRSEEIELTINTNKTRIIQRTQ